MFQRIYLTFVLLNKSVWMAGHADEYSSPHHQIPAAVCTLSQSVAIYQQISS